MVKLTKAKTFQAYLDSCHRRYSCVHCRAHLANHDDLISKSFQGSQGRAYLFNSVVNVGCGPAEERLLLTGLHAVADIYCENCHTTLGWKYEQAFELSQKYKEGKYIIELSHMIKDNGWDWTRKKKPTVFLFDFLKKGKKKKVASPRRERVPVYRPHFAFEPLLCHTFTSCSFAKFSMWCLIFMLLGFFVDFFHQTLRSSSLMTDEVCEERVGDVVTRAPGLWWIF